jgi:hypothetical protein
LGSLPPVPSPATRREKPPVGRHARARAGRVCAVRRSGWQSVGSNPISSTIRMMGDWPLAFIGLALLVRLFPTSWFLKLVGEPSSSTTIPSQTPAPRTQTVSVGERVRAQSLRLGGGAYLGLAPGGGWVTADPEHGVMVLGPPRSGKTSMIVIPSILAAPGAVISTAARRPRPRNENARRPWRGHRRRRARGDQGNR